jgi:hypothetical protein
MHPSAVGTMYWLNSLTGVNGCLEMLLSGLFVFPVAMISLECN